MFQILLKYNFGVLEKLYVFRCLNNPYKKETSIAHCAAGLRFIFCIIFPHLQSSGPLPESVLLP